MTENIKNNKRNIIIIVVLLIIGFLLISTSKNKESADLDGVSKLGTTTDIALNETSELDEVTDELDNTPLNELDREIVAFDEEKFPIYGDIALESDNINTVPPNFPPDFQAEPESILISPEDEPQLYLVDGELTLDDTTIVDLTVYTSEIDELVNGVRLINEKVSLLLANNIDPVSSDLPSLIAALEKLIDDLNTYIQHLDEAQSLL